MQRKHNCVVCFPNWQLFYLKDSITFPPKCYIKILLIIDWLYFPHKYHSMKSPGLNRKHSRLTATDERFLSLDKRNTYMYTWYRNKFYFSETRQCTCSSCSKTFFFSRQKICFQQIAFQFLHSCALINHVTTKSILRTVMNENLAFRNWVLIDMKC